MNHHQPLGIPPTRLYIPLNGRGIVPWSRGADPVGIREFPPAFKVVDYLISIKADMEPASGWGAGLGRACKVYDGLTHGIYARMPW